MGRLKPVVLVVLSAAVVSAVALSVASALHASPDVMALVFVTLVILGGLLAGVIADKLPSSGARASSN